MGSPQKFIELLELLGLGQYKFIRPDPNVRNLDFFFMLHVLTFKNNKTVEVYIQLFFKLAKMSKPNVKKREGELKRDTNPVVAVAGFTDKQLTEMREIFSMFDEDGSGSIDAGMK